MKFERENEWDAQQAQQLANVNKEENVDARAQQVEENGNLYVCMISSAALQDETCSKDRESVEDVTCLDGKESTLQGVSAEPKLPVMANEMNVVEDSSHKEFEGINLALSVDLEDKAVELFPNQSKSDGETVHDDTSSCGGGSTSKSFGEKNDNPSEEATCDIDGGQLPPSKMIVKDATTRLISSDVRGTNPEDIATMEEGSHTKKPEKTSIMGLVHEQYVSDPLTEPKTGERSQASLSYPSSTNWNMFLEGRTDPMCIAIEEKGEQLKEHGNEGIEGPEYEIAEQGQIPPSKPPVSNLTAPVEGTDPVQVATERSDEYSEEPKSKRISGGICEDSKPPVEEHEKLENKGQLEENRDREGEVKMQGGDYYAAAVLTEKEKLREMVEKRQLEVISELNGRVQDLEFKLKKKKKKMKQLKVRTPRARASPCKPS